MSIVVQDLLTAKARKFGTSEDSLRFQAIFIDAVNYTLDDIENLTGTATTRIARISETIDLDQQTYQAVLSLGIDFYIQDHAEFSVEPLLGVEARYKDKLKTTRMVYWASTDRPGKLGDLSE